MQFNMVPSMLIISITVELGCKSSVNMLGVAKTCSILKINDSFNSTMLSSTVDIVTDVFCWPDTSTVLMLSL